jgi:hypothetical protein
MNGYGREISLSDGGEKVTQYTTWLGFVVPPVLGAIIMGLFGLVRMWSSIDRHTDEHARARRDLDILDRRLGDQETVSRQHGQTLAEIAEGVEWIKSALAQIAQDRHQ